MPHYITISVFVVVGLICLYVVLIIFCELVGHAYSPWAIEERDAARLLGLAALGHR